MLKGQFDFIIGNPPWLSYRYISDLDYQKEVKLRAVTRYEIAPKKVKLFTQMELATVFLAHSMATFATPQARLSFVMPRSVLSADQHQNLIRRTYSSDAHFRLTGYWDLLNVHPLFNVPACVLSAKWDATPGSAEDKLPAVEWSGALPGRDVSWDTAKEHLESDKKQARTIYLGSRAALSTVSGASEESKPSKYQGIFKQGATILPRSFYFVRVTDLDGDLDPGKVYWAETDPEQAAQAKKPYDDVKIDGLVEGKFIYSTVISRHVLPFAVLNPAPIVVPIEENDGKLSVVTADELTNQGYRDFGKWMAKAEDFWTAKRKEKADSQSVYERLD